MNKILQSIVDIGKKQEAANLSFLWCAISACSATLAGNVYLKFGNSKLYPNLYIMLLGSAGKRKSTPIKEINSICTELRTPGLCGDKTSMEKYLEDLYVQSMGGDPLDFDVHTGSTGSVTPSFIVQDEFVDFIGVHNYPFVAKLGSFWDINTSTKYRVKNGTEIDIPCPIVNILGATTPSQFHAMFPPSMSEQGFLSRLLIIDTPANKCKVSLPLATPVEIMEAARDNLRRLSTIRGEMTITPEALVVQDEIYKSWQPLTDTRFSHYQTRRHTQLLKLSIVFACTSTCGTTILPEHIIGANTLLSYAESRMSSALGVYGKNRDGDTASKILDILNRIHPKGVQIDALYATVTSDINKKGFIEVLEGLKYSGKLVLTHTGIYATKTLYTDTVTKHIDWTLLDGYIPDYE